jgi:hypothetical protein
MTDKEKAIVMAYTGICMLTGDKFQIFHKYVEDIMGRPIWTHEMGIKSIENEIKEKSKADFITLCADESSSDNSSKWISVKDRMPKDDEWVLCQLDDEFYDENTMMVLYHTDDWGEKWVDGGLGTGSYDVCAWMPLPKPYKEDNNG